MIKKRRLELDGHEEGLLWLEVRKGLSDHRERLLEAYAVGRYEMESAILDDVARKIADKLSEALQPWSKAEDAGL